MNRVLLVAPDKQTGGIARWTNSVMEYFHNLGKKPCELELYSTSRSSFINDDIAFWPRLRQVWKDYPKILSGFTRRLSAHDYDVMHLTSSAGWGLLRDLYMIQKAHKKGIKTIVHFRFGRIPSLCQKKNWEYRLLRKVVSASDTIIVIDNSSYVALKESGCKNIRLLPNPLSPRISDLISAAGEVRRIPGTISFIGHCIYTKGVRELVLACRDLTGVRLRMIGNIHDDVREDLIGLSGHGSWLEFPGAFSFENVIGELLSCDVFVLPSYTEGFPNIVLEAMACGCAIVTTSVGAIPEMLEEDESGKYGIMVAPMKVEELRDAIVALMSYEALKDEMRRNVQRRVFDRYGFSSIWERMTTIWEETAKNQK